MRINWRTHYYITLLSLTLLLSLFPWIAGLAEKKEYDKEFNADTWTLYALKTDLGRNQILEFPLVLIVALVAGIIAILLAITVYKRRSLH